MDATFEVMTHEVKQLISNPIAFTIQVDIFSRKCDLMLFIYDHLVSRMDQPATDRERDMVRALRSLVPRYRTARYQSSTQSIRPMALSVNSPSQNSYNPVEFTAKEKYVNMDKELLSGPSVNQLKTDSRDETVAVSETSIYDLLEDRSSSPSPAKTAGAISMILANSSPLRYPVEEKATNSVANINIRSDHTRFAAHSERSVTRTEGKSSQLLDDVLENCLHSANVALAMHARVFEREILEPYSVAKFVAVVSMVRERQHLGLESLEQMRRAANVAGRAVGFHDAGAVGFAVEVRRSCALFLVVIILIFCLLVLLSLRLSGINDNCAR
jgi:hypothetical protein